MRAFPMNAIVRGALAAALACVLATACDQPFEPYRENETLVFSMFGALDLYADTQWVRVMPVRQSSLLDAAPLDATVTLERLDGRQTIVLRDSVFSFRDENLGASAYAHNFWTTERLQPRATYRLKAVQADGDSSSALVTMPDEIRVTFENDVRTLQGSAGTLYVQAPDVLSADVLYLMRSTCGVGGLVRAVPQARIPNSGAQKGFIISGLLAFGECLQDERRQEIRITVGPLDWPYTPDLSDLDVARPGSATSNVVNGLGFVGGLAIRTIPFHRCQQLVARPGGQRTCEVTYDERSGTVSGRVIRQPCGAPHAVQDVRLTERYTNGGAIVRHWKTGWNGEYRFEGIEPGSELEIEVRPIEPGLAYSLAPSPFGAVSDRTAASAQAAPMRIPPLAEGQRLALPDIAVSTGC